MKRLDVKKVLTGWAVVSILLTASTLFFACSTPQAQGIKIDSSLKEFLEKNVPAAAYGFYILKNTGPVSETEFRESGLWICSKAPEGLFPSSVSNQLYGGGFLSGTVVTLDGGMAGFEWLPVKIMIGITPEGCVKAVRKEGQKAILLFDRQHVSEVKGELQEVYFQ
jgi:hypothetical protein